MKVVREVSLSKGKRIMVSLLKVIPQVLRCASLLRTIFASFLTLL